MREVFRRFSGRTAESVGSPAAFVIGLTLIVLWALTGPLFGYSDSWQLVVNTATTIITFLMVFLIQATQNRDAEATQVKLDEIIRAIEGAHNVLLDLEELEEEELDAMRLRYEKLAEHARRELRRGRGDTGVPPLSVGR